MPEVYQSRTDIPAEARSGLVDLLNRQLADTTDLYTQVKYAHWNVVGSDFIQLHELFDEIAGDLFGYTDLIAERLLCEDAHNQTFGSRTMGYRDCSASRTKRCC